MRTNANKSELTPFRCGFIALIGRPNVGKSTLINAILHQKIAAVSSRPQTTRHSQMGILTTPEAQLIFIDTPGFQKPHHNLDEKMIADAVKSMDSADILLLVFDCSQPPLTEDTKLIEQFSSKPPTKPLLLALNKLDLATQDQLENWQSLLSVSFPASKVIPISSTQGSHLDELVDLLTQVLPAGEALFPEDQVTDSFIRDIAADLIREAALNSLREEIPHGIAVRIDSFAEREDGSQTIEATLFVEKDSHKGIVIGAGGQMIKQIGILARREIERMSSIPTHLHLQVKVHKNWRKDEKMLKWLGY